MHPWDLLTDDELAVSSVSPPEALQRILQNEPTLFYAHLDKAHLMRSDGDYCPWDCEQCDWLKLSGY